MLVLKHSTKFTLCFPVTMESWNCLGFILLAIRRHRQWRRSRLLTNGTENGPSPTWHLFLAEMQEPVWKGHRATQGIAFPAAIFPEI